jgi:hypothetical protein
MEQKAVYEGPNKGRQGEIVTLWPDENHPDWVIVKRPNPPFKARDEAKYYRPLSDVTSLAPEIDDTPAEERMVYRGKYRSLYNKTALVRPTDDPEFADAQFDDQRLGAWSCGWHRLARKVFHPLDIADQFQHSPYASAGIGDREGPMWTPSAADAWPWVIDDPYIEPDTWPWLLAGIGLSDMPPAPAPTKPARKVHRLGRLFDDAPARTPVNHGPAPASMMRVMDGAQWDAAVLVRGEGE